MHVVEQHLPHVLARPDQHDAAGGLSLTVSTVDR